MGALVRVARRKLIWLNVGRCWHQSAIRANLNNSIGRDGFAPNGCWGKHAANNRFFNKFCQWPKAGSTPICRIIAILGGTDHVCSSIELLELVGMCNACGLLKFAKAVGSILVVVASGAC